MRPGLLFGDDCHALTSSVMDFASYFKLDF